MRQGLVLIAGLVGQVGQLPLEVAGGRVAGYRGQRVVSPVVPGAAVADSRCQRVVSLHLAQGVAGDRG